MNTAARASFESSLSFMLVSLLKWLVVPCECVSHLDAVVSRCNLSLFDAIVFDRLSRELLLGDCCIVFDDGDATVFFVDPYGSLVW